MRNWLMSVNHSQPSGAIQKANFSPEVAIAITSQHPSGAQRRHAVPLNQVDWSYHAIPYKKNAVRGPPQEPAVPEALVSLTRTPHNSKAPPKAPTVVFARRFSETSFCPISLRDALLICPLAKNSFNAHRPP